MVTKKQEKAEWSGVSGFRREGSALLGRLEAARKALLELRESAQQFRMGPLFSGPSVPDILSLLDPAPFRALGEAAFLEEGSVTEDVALVRSSAIVLAAVPPPPGPAAPPTQISSFARSASDCAVMAAAILSKAGVMPYFGSEESVAEGEDLRVVLRFEGEGLCGKYDPSVFQDTRLMRFRVFVKSHSGFAESEGASRLTMIPATSPREHRDRAAKLILDAILSESEASGDRVSARFLPESLEAVCWRMSYLRLETIKSLSAASA